MLDEILQRLQSMPDKEREELEALAVEATKDMRWIPNPGPQTDAYFHDADILLYGGAGGGGKSDLGLGLAFNCHQRALVMRRKYVDLSGLVDRAVEINGTRSGLNASPPPRLTTGDGRIIEFGAAQRVGDEQSWQGRARDLLYVDEAAQFAESQIRFLMGWVRSAKEGQRCRIVFGSNPPLSDEGLWMVTMFAPWLDPQHPDYPAEPGQLRWFITDAGKDYEVPGPGDYLLDEHDFPHLVEGEDPEALTALSRTFIPSRLSDNPYLMRDKQYKAQQDALPPHLRAAIRDGNFTATRSDHELQLIPGEWIRAAQERWKRVPHPPAGVPMCNIAVDIAQGGTDNTVLQPRYDFWFAEATILPGSKTPLGADVAGEIFKVRRDNCMITLDMGGGYGGATYEQLIQTVEPEAIYKYKGSKSTSARTQYSNMEFANVRAEAYWRLYEALDPSQPGGSQICLPPSQRLYGDLCSIRWAKNPDDQRVVQIETKKDLVARIGRSTDEGDAVVMSWYRGVKGANIQGGWKQRSSTPRPSVKMGRGANSYSRRGR